MYRVSSAEMPGSTITMDGKGRKPPPNENIQTRNEIKMSENYLFTFFLCPTNHRRIWFLLLLQSVITENKERTENNYFYA